MMLLMSIHSSAQKQISRANDPTRYAIKADTLKGYAVAPFSDILFKLYNRAGSFSAQERAAAINKRIQKLADDYYFS